MGQAQKTHDKQTVIDKRIELMREHAPQAAGLMKALGNESRLMILCTLAESECSVGELNAMIPLSQSALSQQLARLRQQGLVRTRRESQTIYYALAKGPADRIIHLLHDIYCGTELPAATEAH
ncbi:MAG: metalloregulator ArsR/SmtB family transcription factor [Gammaproteobacteria bacterium]|nr:metalloregulator ArsR/SmtB family transcription factor [Gammaproteobacteria bacterium]MDH3373480.1 metalloregulator ArsR/SmtB family transcription factor [Gammaproteobacteria bacterium]MDH3408681.1 metalloregulator ArsR/SmtB family transcription factor [Gammaproteobacteria bacterium]MDH3551468.1 metalloregulator ArsR/SmtB family transcription factor [Gammaproteobacteria bacterium]